MDTCEVCNSFSVYLLSLWFSAWQTVLTRTSGTPIASHHCSMTAHLSPYCSPESTFRCLFREVIRLTAHIYSPSFKDESNVQNKVFLFFCICLAFTRGEILLLVMISQLDVRVPHSILKFSLRFFPLSKTFGEKIWIKTLHKLFLEEIIPHLLSSLLSNIA